MERSFGVRLIRAWTSPRASLRDEVEQGEARLFAYAFGGAVFLTLGPVVAEVIAPTALSTENPQAWIAARTFSGLSFGVLALYAVAALLAGGARLFGARFDGKAGRAALFWSALVSGPIACAAHIGAAFAGLGAIGGVLAGLVWCGLLAPMTAEAFGFSTNRVAIVFSALAFSAFALGRIA